MSNSNFLDPSQLPAGKPQGQQATNQSELNTHTNVGDAGILPNQPNPHGLAGRVTNNHTGQNGTTHFGFKQVSLEQKQDKVAGVFHSVAAKYDLMNDLMSMGIHRLWKRFAISLSGVRSGQSVLDIAGGTGDLALAFSRVVGDTGRVVLSDINSSMLQVGKERLINAGCDNVDVVLANAEDLEPFEDESFDLVTISFGLRNVTDKDAALRSMLRVLKPGGRLLILEFSKPGFEPLSKVYDIYSFTALPVLGKLFAGDSESYRYLAESIRMHPDQNTLKNMMSEAGFVGAEFHNLTGGITALHRGFKAEAAQ
jgi:demethylmenaquinone methyltransferase/2-methoxy-6-polyprenyl-1,4-benzoquinol methylase